ncbi:MULTISPECIES: DUF5685 family protein [Nocardiopsidaceae]|uniref:DUF5685 family protein n=1 Tax=Streptomonospora nanhaiensis TaxID=1323731 RepID=A0ABY6YH19_9ACTN|nr:DUF5685 family protein [Streptomonospora nanhaiensis]WAE71570.1 DUF5685 family protein [Streptomonospora nanhaiensis]
MFGILRPCRHSLPDGLAEEWMSHMCGLCLALRDDHGQASRVATNYDGLVVSVLTAAQSEKEADTRAAGRCPLRGMRGARAANGSGAYLAAAVSLMLASAKITDHIEDGDGLYGRRGVRSLAGRVAARWRHGATEAGDRLGFDGAGLIAVIDRQREVELAAGEGTDILTVTAPTEEATGEAFAHTALLADRPANAAPLREAGRLFGRIAHLLDAVEDREEDLVRGAWNPLTATDTGPDRARELCDGAVLGVRLALEEAEFTDDRLVRALLVRELGRSVDRVFSQAGYPAPGPHGPHHPQGPHQHQAPGPHTPRYSHGPHDAYGVETPHRGGGHHHGGHGPGEGGHGSGSGGGKSGGGGCCDACSCDTPALSNPPKTRGFFSGCAVALFMCGTCQFCCRDPHPGPWTGKPRNSWCDLCECCNCCQCCACCEGV